MTEELAKFFPVLANLASTQKPPGVYRILVLGDPMQQASSSRMSNASPNCLNVACPGWK